MSGQNLAEARRTGISKALALPQVAKQDCSETGAKAAARGKSPCDEEQATAVARRVHSFDPTNLRKHGQVHRNLLKRNIAVDTRSPFQRLLQFHAHSSSAQVRRATNHLFLVARQVPNPYFERLFEPWLLSLVTERDSLGRVRDWL